MHRPDEQRIVNINRHRPFLIFLHDLGHYNQLKPLASVVVLIPQLHGLFLPMHDHVVWPVNLIVFLTLDDIPLLVLIPVAVRL
ncbi:hypothetical protein D3C75_885750 [compost metagenome]